MAVNKQVYLIGYATEIVSLTNRLDVSLQGVIDGSRNESFCLHVPIIGDDNWFLSMPKNQNRHYIIVPQDSGRVKERIWNMYNKNGCDLLSLLAGNIDENTNIGRGAITQYGSHVSVGCQIGDLVKINYGANVMHDCVIGNYSTIGPNAVLLGYVKVGNRVFVGANATILPGVAIGDDVVVGAGAVVTRDVGSGLTVKGVPAK